MTELTPPPAPESKSIQDNEKFQKFALLAFLVAVFLLIVVLVVPGDNNNSSPATTQYVAPSTTQYVPPTNKYDDFYNHVINNSGKAYVYTKGEIIEFGEIVCSALDSGKSINQVVTVLEATSNDLNDMKLFAAIVYGAIHNICPQYISDLNYYLST